MRGQSGAHTDQMRMRDPEALEAWTDVLPGPGATAAPARRPIADLGTSGVLAVIGALHGRRTVACRHWTPAPTGAVEVWDWMCGSDPFASWSFMPLHTLAAAAAIGWLLLSLRGSLGFVWRTFCAREGDDDGSTRRMTLRHLELYLAMWALCWFSPAQPFVATADCLDKDQSCPSWAASGECQKNEAFMRDTCRKSCQACIQVLDGESGWHAAGPRSVSLCAGGTLLVLAVVRHLLANTSEEAHRRVSRAVCTFCRPLNMLAALFMR